MVSPQPKKRSAEIAEIPDFFAMTKRRHMSPSPSASYNFLAWHHHSAITRLGDEETDIIFNNDPIHRMAHIIRCLSKPNLGHVEQTIWRKNLQDLAPVLKNAQHQTSATFALTHTMRSFDHCPNVQLECIRMLHAVLDSSVSGETAKTTIHNTVNALLIFPNDARLQCLGIDLLRKLKLHLIKGDEKIRATCVIFNSHRNHFNIDFLQQVSLCLLAWLVEDDTCLKVLCRLGGLDSILKAMSEYPKDAMVQCNATAIICWMIHGSSRAAGEQGQESHPVSLEPWAIPIVVRALMGHFEEVSVFGNCVCLLSGISDLPKEKAVFDLVRKGMEIHKASAKAQEACLRWIRFRNVRQYTAQLISCLPVILQTMEQHAEDRNVQAQACEVLVMLLDVPETRAAVLEQGTVDVVLKALENHKKDGHIQHAAVWFLTLLLPFNEESAAQREATTAFGGGFLGLETVWRGMGIETLAGTPPVIAQ